MLGLNRAEALLLSSSPSELKTVKYDEQVLDLFVAIAEGRYHHVLESEAGKTVLDFFEKLISSEFEQIPVEVREKGVGDLLNGFEAHVGTLLKGADDVTQAKVFAVGVTFLSIYMRNNVTGPAYERGFSFLSDENLALLNKFTLSSLAMSGEDVYLNATDLFTLDVARRILVQNSSLYSSKFHSISWWAARVCVQHQRLLSENVRAIRDLTESYFPDAISNYGLNLDIGGDHEEKSISDLRAKTSPLEQALSAQLYVEAGRNYQTYWKYTLVEDCLERASKSIGLDFECTGIMGVRTRFQRDKKAQLVVKARSSTASTASSATSDSDVSCGSTIDDEALLPIDVALDDDTLLENPSLDEDVNVFLTTVDRTVLLAWSLEVRNKNPTGDELAEMEILAFVERVLLGARKGEASYAVMFSALHSRSYLQRKTNRKQDRSLMQIESLTYEFDRLRGGWDASDDKKDQLAAFRLRDAYACDLRPVWEVKGQLAEHYMGLKLVNSALRIYEELRMYTDLIGALIAVGRKTEAEKLIREQIELHGDHPRWYNHLGEILDSDEYYLKAWELSNHSNANSQRMLGKRKRLANKHDEALEHYRLALTLNPMSRDTQFAAGFCAMEMKKYDIAAPHFNRTVALDPDYADAWNNLAAAHMYLKNKPQAFLALEQAVRLKRDNWRVWENYMHTAIDIRKYQQAMTAMEQIVDLKEKYVDTEALNIICKAVQVAAEQEHRERETPLEEVFVVDRFIRLCGKLTSKVVTKPGVWSAMAEIYEFLGNTEKRIMYREKETRCAEKMGWETEVLRAEPVFVACHELVQAYLAHPSSSNLLSARLLVDRITSKAKTSTDPKVSDHEKLTSLEKMLHAIEEVTQKEAEKAAPAVEEPEDDPYADWR